MENELIEDKFTKFEEIAIEIILIIYLINIKKKNIIFHFFEEIFPFLDEFLQYLDPITQKMADKKINFINFRKYIYLILLILNDQVKEKLKKKENCTKELLIYQEIINTIININNKHKKDSSQAICLNERFIAIINNFEKYQIAYEKILKEDNKLEIESSEIVQKYNQYNPNESQEKMISNEPTSSMVLNYTIKDNIPTGTYKVTFKLCNSNHIVDTVDKYIIIKTVP